MSMKIRELQEKRAKLAADIQELGTVQPADWDADQEDRWTTVNSEYDSLGTEIETLQRSEEEANERRARKAAIDAEMREMTPTALQKRHPSLRERNAEAEYANREERSAKLMQTWLRHGSNREINEQDRQLCSDLQFDFTRSQFDVALRGASLHNGYGSWSTAGGGGYMERTFDRRWEKRALGTPKDGSGGETIPEGFQRELERAMLDFGGIGGVCRRWSTSGFNPVPWPTTNDTGNAGDIIAENTQVSATDPAFSVVTFDAYKFTSDLVLASAELLEDSAFNLGAELASMLGERLARGLAGYLATGTGTAQPEGITIGSAEGIVAASSTAITSDELIDMVHSVDPAYRRGSNVGWIFNDSTLAAIRKLKDSEGNYLWRPGLTLAEPDLLLGFRYTIDQAMPSMGEVDNRVLVFGNLSKYVCRDHSMLRFYRLEERYRDFDQTGFVAFRRHDAKVVDAGTNPIKYLAMAAA